MDIELAKKVAISAVKEAAKLLNDNFLKPKNRSFKGRGDIVTEIDIQSEKIILDLIKSNFPDHAILSEEAGLTGDETVRYMWIIDPIDGTTNYYYGMNPYRVGICLLEDERPILNVLYNPTKDEAYVAQKGGGAFLNDKKIAVSDTAELKDSVAMFHLSSKKEPRLKTLAILDSIAEASSHMRMYGSCLAQLSYIASGKFDAYFNIVTSPWDILPGALLIEEAGGKVTDIHGKEIAADSTSVVASNGKVHDQMLKLLENL